MKKSKKHTDKGKKSTIWSDNPKMNTAAAPKLEPVGYAMGGMVYAGPALSPRDRLAMRSELSKQ